MLFSMSLNIAIIFLLSHTVICSDKVKESNKWHFDKLSTFSVGLINRCRHYNQNRMKMVFLAGNELYPEISSKRQHLESATFTLCSVTIILTIKTIIRQNALRAISMLPSLKCSQNSSNQKKAKSLFNRTYRSDTFLKKSAWVHSVSIYRLRAVSPCE